MNHSFLKYFLFEGEEAVLGGGDLRFGHKQVPIRDAIPRFTQDANYASENFGKLRERYGSLQLDSRNGTGDRMETVLRRTNWPPEFFHGKTVLECGCGAGPDTEILLALGARVLAVDLTGTDVAKANIGANDNVQFVQASITDLPLKTGAFDIVFCHRVLQHTPDPAKALAHILQYVKDDGAAFVHSYAPGQRWTKPWKYLLRPLTTRMNPSLLFSLIRFFGKPLYNLTNLMSMTKVTRKLAKMCVPFCNHRGRKGFPDDDDLFLAYGIHNTFDALSPKYDNPLNPDIMEDIARRQLLRPLELVRGKQITLLRTVIDRNSAQCVE